MIPHFNSLFSFNHCFMKKGHMLNTSLSKMLHLHHERAKRQICNLGLSGLILLNLSDSKNKRGRLREGTWVAPSIKLLSLAKVIILGSCSAGGVLLPLSATPPACALSLTLPLYQINQIFKKRDTKRNNN